MNILLLQFERHIIEKCIDTLRTLHSSQCFARVTTSQGLAFHMVRPQHLSSSVQSVLTTPTAILVIQCMDLQCEIELSRVRIPVNGFSTGNDLLLIKSLFKVFTLFSVCYLSFMSFGSINASVSCALPFICLYFFLPVLCRNVPHCHGSLLSPLYDLPRFPNLCGALAPDKSHQHLTFNEFEVEIVSPPPTKFFLLWSTPFSKEEFGEPATKAQNPFCFFLSCAQ